MGEEPGGGPSLSEEGGQDAPHVQGVERREKVGVEKDQTEEEETKRCKGWGNRRRRKDMLGIIRELKQ